MNLSEKSHQNLSDHIQFFSGYREGERDGRYPTKLYNFKLLSAEVLHARHTSEIVLKSNQNLKFQSFGRGARCEGTL